jgi:hypothetical protein
LTGFNLINHLQADWLTELKPSNDHQKVTSKELAVKIHPEEPFMCQLD